MLKSCHHIAKCSSELTDLAEDLCNIAGIYIVTDTNALFITQGNESDLFWYKSIQLLTRAFTSNL